jgi:2-succinyl-6-hydroxy-2,4-cyclohexadiene-1-carboxylate synthase
VVRVTIRPLHFERRGSGPAVMLLHGFTGSGQSMSEVALALARDFEVTTPDLPGHGCSIAVDDGRVYALDECLDRLAATLEKAGHAKAHWIGYSMGARIALAFALRFPGRVDSLLLIGARAGIENASERAGRRRADEALADRIETGGIGAFVDEWLAQPLFASQRRLGREFVAAQRRQRLGNDARGLAASLRGLGPGAQPPLFDDLPRLDVPVLLVAGALDHAFVAHARDLERRLPDAEVREIADAGHAVHLEQPAAFMEAAREFLRRAGRPAQFTDPIPVEETAS